ncbi:MAG TPA: phosphoserine phosphatase SerB [Bacteriovoracaceae bacterium]|nr:phosphoserine phosphatase SerB [Bacteriovoracaceae bacterium]
MKESLLITLSGPERPGITSAFLKDLSRCQVQVLDLGLSTVHGQIFLSILLDPQNGQVIEVLKDEASKHGLTWSGVPLKVAARQLPKVHRYVLSCASPLLITTQYLAAVTGLLCDHGIKIDRIDSKSDATLKALDLICSSAVDVNLMRIKTGLMDLSNVHKIDAAFMEDDLFRYNKKLIVFDMDSTLIQGEVIDELAKAHGIGDQVRAITVRAMNGELGFDQALHQRVALLKGFPRSKMDEIHHKLKLSPGAEKLIQTVRKLGFKTAIVSGGFHYFAEPLRKQLGIDYLFANDLDWDGDVLSGKVKGPVVNAEQKAVILETLAQKENIYLQQVVAIGDGANDLPMLAKAGLGIAFHAKEKVKNEARHQLSHGPMSTILYFLGIPGDHFA